MSEVSFKEQHLFGLSTGLKHLSPPTARDTALTIWRATATKARFFVVVVVVLLEPQDTF